MLSIKIPLTSLLQLHCKNNVLVQIRHASQALPQLSSEKYNVKRKNFGTIQSSDIGFFKSILDEKRVLTDKNDILPYNIDWIKNCRATILMGKVESPNCNVCNRLEDLQHLLMECVRNKMERESLMKEFNLNKLDVGLTHSILANPKTEVAQKLSSQSKLVLRPKNTEELSKILKYCNDRRLAVCPQGGNTGLVGGSVPVFDEIVLSFALMNKIISLDSVSGSVVCEAGCILENLDNYVRERGLIMPLDLGAKGTCHIGGNVSTNAGGLRLLRYGNLHGSILGIEAVKADGTVIDCLKSLKKDNTGYHLKHLFIGSEGTLGLVTKVAIHCPVLPNAVNLGFFGVKNFDNILKLYKSAKTNLGEILSAFEMADFDAINTTVKNLKLPNPIADYPFYVLVETHGSNEAHDSEKLMKFLSKEMETGLILDGTVTSEPSKMQTIWNLRESIAGASLTAGYVFKYDVSIPQKHYYDLVPILKKRMGDRAVSVYGYGHVGDGNIHINVVVPEYNSEVASLMEPYIFEEVSKVNGSISAEHGIGFRKPKYIHYSKDQSALHLMSDLKKLMDPNGILNPYKVLPDEP